MPGSSTDKARNWPWLLGVFAVAVLLSLIATRWTFDMWTWQNDEFIFRQTARWIGDNLPSSLWATNEYERGIQRLNAWLFAFALDVFGSPAGFKVARWVIVLAFASTVVPVWLLARAAGAERVWAAIAALGAVLVPWAGLTGTFLTEGLAYPLLGWALLAIFATVAKPSLRADLLVLVAIGAAVLARTGMVLLAITLVIAVIGQELRLAAGPRDLLRVPVRVARRHALLVAVGLAGLLLLAIGRADKLTGSWYENTAPRWGDTWHGLTYAVSSVAAGVGFVPVLAALGFALTQIVRPRSARDLALAWIVVGLLATVTVTLISGPVEERYVFYWALPCAVALAVAASRRAASIPAIVAATALVIVAMGDRVWRTDIYSFWGFVQFPAESFQARVVRLGVSDRLPGALSVDGRTVSVIVIVLAAIVTAVIASPLPRALAATAAPWLRRAALALGCLVVFGGAVQAGWAMHKFVKLGGGGRDLHARTTIERLADGRRVGIWLPPAPPGAASPTWQELRYYSPDVRGLYRLGVAQDAPLVYGEGPSPVVVDPANGRVVPANAGDRLPGLMVVIAGQHAAPLRGRVLGRDRDLGVDLVNPTKPMSVRWAAGPSLDGAIDPRNPQTVRVFPPFPKNPCLHVTVAMTSGTPGAFLLREGTDAVFGTARSDGRPSDAFLPLAKGRADDVRITLGRPHRSAASGKPVTGSVDVQGIVACPRADEFGVASAQVKPASAG